MGWQLTWPDCWQQLDPGCTVTYHRDSLVGKIIPFWPRRSVYQISFEVAKSFHIGPLPVAVWCQHLHSYLLLNIQSRFIAHFRIPDALIRKFASSSNSVPVRRSKTFRCQTLLASSHLAALTWCCNLIEGIMFSSLHT